MLEPKLPIRLEGVVQKGAARGRILGFPTANIDVADYHGEDGIFLARTYVGGQVHGSLVFIGEAKTFQETERKVESYILDFDQMIYGQPIVIELLEKLRENQAFDSAESLRIQMDADRQAARHFFNADRSGQN